MAHDLLDLIVRTNLVLAATIAVVLPMRAPLRRWFGARIAYWAWAIPPLAALTCLLPQRVRFVEIPALPEAALRVAPAAHHATVSPTNALLALWVAGALLCVLILALRQRRFIRSLGRLVIRGDRVFGAETSAGPAVVGALRPVIVTPADFEHRYSAEEREIVLAHERAHLAHGDPMINAAAALVQSINWFNPMVHIGVRALRMDQELACDAAVIAQAQQPRRVYAEAMLKAHAAPIGPLVCAWPAPNLNPLKERIAMLKRNPPSRTQLWIGASVVALVTLGVCTSAWTAQPTRVVALQAHPAAAEAPEAPEPPEAAEAPDVDTSAVEQAAHQLSLHAMRLAQQAIAEQNGGPRMSAAERAQLERQVHAEAALVQRQAMEAARAGMAQARDEMQRQQVEMRQQRADREAARDQLRAQSDDLRAQARDLQAHRAEMTADQQSAAEAQLEAQAQELAAAAMQVASHAIENALANHNWDGDDDASDNVAPPSPDDANDPDSGKNVAPH